MEYIFSFNVLQLTIYDEIYDEKKPDNRFWLEDGRVVLIKNVKKISNGYWLNSILWKPEQIL